MERRGGCSRLGEFAKSKQISGCQRSSWEKAGFLYVPPPSNHQTSWRYNHLIVHHYGLSNFIKPHTWFWLCCSTTTLPPHYYSHFYHTYIEVPLLMFCFWNVAQEQECVLRDFRASRRGCGSYLSQETFWTNVTAPATFWTWLAVAWSWHWLWMWYYGVLFSWSGGC